MSFSITPRGGALTARGGWNAKTPYYQDDIVIFGGQEYQSLLPVNLGNQPDISGFAWAVPATQAAVTKESPVNITHPAFGAKLDNSHDDGPAIAAALAYAATVSPTSGPGEVFFPNGTPKLTSPIALPNSPIIIFGEGRDSTNVNQTAVAAAFQGPSVSASLENVPVTIRDMSITSAGDCIYLPNGANDLKILAKLYPGVTGTGVHVLGFLQQHDWDLDIHNGKYGIWHDSQDGTAGTHWLHDKGIIRVYTTGQSENGIFLDAPNGRQGNNTTIVPRSINFCTKHGMRIRGAIAGLVIINLNTEGNGFLSGAAYVAPLQCSTTGGNTTVQLLGSPGSWPTALQMPNGTAVTIQGPNGSPSTFRDLTTTVSSYNPATGVVVLAAAPPVTLASTEFYPAQYDDVILEAQPVSGVCPSGVTFINPDLGSESGVNAIRYGLNALGTDGLGIPTGILVVNDRSVRSIGGANRPLYCNSGNVKFIGGIANIDPARVRGVPGFDIAEEVFIPAQNFVLDTGTPTFGLQNGATQGYLAWSLPNTANSGITAIARIPAEWRTYYTFVEWTNLGAGAGNVVMNVSNTNVNAALNAAGDFAQTTPAVAAPAQHGVAESQIGTNTNGVSARGSAGYVLIRLFRPTGGADTLANAVGVTGMRLVRAS